MCNEKSKDRWPSHHACMGSCTMKLKGLDAMGIFAEANPFALTLIKKMQ